MAMVQWVNRLRNNIFVNAPSLPLLCEISGALHLAQPGLMVGWRSNNLYKNLVILYWYTPLSIPKCIQNALEAKLQDFKIP